MLLQELPGLSVVGMDGSQLMLERANERLSRFGNRFRLSSFNLADRAWRKLQQPAQAVISSLAIHHLDGAGKQALFADVYTMLAMEGAFIIADMIDPTTPPGRRVAADAWDEVVRQRSIELDGNIAGLDFFRREGWNTYHFLDPDDIDHPSRLVDQLKWLEKAGFVDVDVHFMQAGHALFSGWKKE